MHFSVHVAEFVISYVSFSADKFSTVCQRVVKEERQELENHTRKTILLLMLAYKRLQFSNIPFTLI